MVVANAEAVMGEHWMRVSPFVLVGESLLGGHEATIVRRSLGRWLGNNRFVADGPDDYFLMVKHR